MLIKLYRQVSKFVINKYIYKLNLIIVTAEFRFIALAKFFTSTL